MLFVAPKLPSDPASSGGGKAWTPGTSGTAITGSQQTQLQVIRDRDAEFDTELDEIGEGIQDLHELAQRQGEEVQRQNQMLENTSSRIDKAQEVCELLLKFFCALYQFVIAKISFCIAAHG
jgi:glucokinase